MIRGSEASSRGRGLGHEGIRSQRLVEQLATDHHDDLVRYISRRVRSVADAREIAQEAYVRLLRLDRTDLIREPRAYLYRVATHVLYEFELKSRTDQMGRVRWKSEKVSGAADLWPTRALDQLALKERMEAALAELSPKCRAVLILHRRDGLTYQEISERIGISISMVKKYLLQGLQHCRQALSDCR